MHVLARYRYTVGRVVCTKSRLKFQGFTLISENGEINILENFLLYGILKPLSLLSLSKVVSWIQWSASKISVAA